MREAVIVSAARTPIAKAYRGAYNNTQAQELAGHAVCHAVQRAGVEDVEIDDLVMGCAFQQGSSSGNIARQYFFNLFTAISVHLHHAANALFLFLYRVKYRSTAFQLT